MKYQPENELLSAYLDGELTATEKARVEQLLADSPAARQLLDELRTIGSTLQSLPRQKLDVDLSEQVMLAAAQRKKSGLDDPQPASPQTRPLLGNQSFGRKIADRIKKNPRMVVWPLIVVTVAVLLAVFNPQQDRDIALNTKVSPTVTTTNPPPLIPKGMQDDGKEQTTPALAGLVVLQCQVSRETLKQQDYRKIFDANNLAMPENSAAEVLHITSAELAVAVGLDATIVSSESNAANAEPKAKIILVEVTPDQIAGILNSLKAMPEMFRDVSVKIMPSVQTQPQISAAPPPGTKVTSTKRMLLVFRAVDSSAK